MAYISFDKCKKKIVFPIISIIIYYILYNLEYYSGYYFDFKKFNVPKLYTLNFSFSFLACFVFGGIFLLISYINTKEESNNTENKEEDDRKKKDLKNKKPTRYPSLIYDEEISKIHIKMKYFINSAFLELLVNFFYSSVIFDFVDIEAKILYSSFDIIFIKIVSKFVFKFQFYRHQIFSMILLILILFLDIIIRETFLMKVIKGELNFYDEDFQLYLNENGNAKIESKIAYRYYLIFTFFGFIAKSFSVCFDKWLITSTLCNPYKLLFFKGLYGFFPAFLIQILLYFILGENLSTDKDEINIKNLYKRLSFPFSSFVGDKLINNKFIVILIISFFFLIGFSYISNIAIINSFNPEFIGFVNIVSTTLTIFTIQLINAIISGRFRRSIIISFINLFFLIIILIPSLILCEIIILHFCQCDKNISSSIERRASLEVNKALELYDTEDDDDSKNRTFNSEDFSYRVSSKE